MTYCVGDINATFRRIMDAGAIEIDTVKGFELKHHERFPQAPLSPIRINLRVAENKGPLAEEDVDAIADLMFKYLQHHHIQYDGICGVPRAGEPFAKALQRISYEALRYHVPLLTLEKIEEGSTRKVARLLKTQTLPRGCRVLLVDDLITKAASKLEAIEVLRHEGYKVLDCLVFLDRQQGGRSEMARHGVQLHSVVDFESMILFYKDTAQITADQYKRIVSYMGAERQLLSA